MDQKYRWIYDLCWYCSHWHMIKSHWERCCIEQHSTPMATPGHCTSQRSAGNKNVKQKQPPTPSQKKEDHTPPSKKQVKITKSNSVWQCQHSYKRKTMQSKIIPSTCTLMTDVSTVYVLATVSFTVTDAHMTGQHTALLLSQPQRNIQCHTVIGSYKIHS